MFVRLTTTAAAIAADNPEPVGRVELGAEALELLRGGSRYLDVLRPAFDRDKLGASPFGDWLDYLNRRFLYDFMPGERFGDDVWNCAPHNITHGLRQGVPFPRTVATSNTASQRDDCIAIAVKGDLDLWCNIFVAMTCDMTLGAMMARVVTHLHGAISGVGIDLVAFSFCKCCC